MSSQLVLFTAIPNGFAKNGDLQVSVHISPRLTPSGSPGSLSEFPDFANWPSTPIGWQVSINGATYEATPVSVSNIALYQLLFPATTFVRPFNYQSLTGQNLYSYPTAFARNFFLSAYTTLASTSPTAWPSATDLLDSLWGELPQTDADEQRIIAEILAMFPEGGGPIPAGSSPNPPTDLEQVKLFLQPLVVPPAGSTYPYDPPTAPDIDYHQAVGLVARHPPLMRTFGFVVDLVLPVPSGSFPTVVPVEAVPTWTPQILSPPYSGTSTNVTPIVETDWSTWLPAPRATLPEINSGYLRLSDSEYGTIELDLDGATLKALDFVKNIVRATGPMMSADTPTNYAVPSLRSAGLSLARTANAAALYGALQTGDANNALAVTMPPGTITLNAEDVTQGYRIDVYDSTRATWFRLCARSGAKPGPGGYVIGNPGQKVDVPKGDEGWVELGLTSAGAPTAGPQFLPETLMRWSGWSLVAPRLGAFLSDDPKKGLEKDTHNPPTGTFQLQIDYSATPGTLPVLRFGRTYQFLARAVDMAGNSVPFSSTAPMTWASDAAFYGRMEPVATPFIVPTAPRTPGEHLERIVIRSNYDIPDTDPSILHSSRHIVPPVTSVEMAEAHGVLDTSEGVPNVALYSELAALDGQTYTTPSVVSALGGLYDTQPLNNGISWIYYPSAELAVPYMPDVFARGAAFQYLPGVPATTLVTQVPFTAGTWPTVQGFTLDVGPGSGAPTMPDSSNSYTLSVLAPKASFTTVLLSSYINAADLDDMGLWSWLAAAGEDSSALAETIANGQCWLFTPFRQLVIVHAVQQPMLPPSFTTMSVARAVGDTYALLSGGIDYDPASTSRLDIVSSWTEPFDDGVSSTGLVELPGNARVGELSVASTDVSPETFTNLREDFGDTKHRKVSYEARATTAFLEYFTEIVDVTLTGTTAVVVDSAGFAPGTVIVTGTGENNGVTYFVDIDYAEDDEAGSIAAIAGGGLASGSVVQVAYAQPSVIRSSLETEADPPTPTGYPLSIPSATRPTVPDVRYILPAFAWDYSATPTPTSTRTGNLLRVYLGRPWWNTGEGELLGVVIADPAPISVDLQPFVTGYGADPLFVTGAANATPQLADYTLAVASGTSLVLAEQTTPSGTVAVAGHTVQWDPGRQLWFADIAIDAGSSYWPFVKLALVRYQPASISGVEISRVVQADFAQLAPNRVATLTFPTTTTVTVTVVGPSYTESNAIEVFLPPDMRVWVEAQIPGVTDPDLQWAITPTGSPGTPLTPTQEADSVTSWTGTVTLPAARGTQPFRILIGEREQYVQVLSGNETLRTTYLDNIQI